MVFQGLEVQLATKRFSIVETSQLQNLSLPHMEIAPRLRAIEYGQGKQHRYKVALVGKANMAKDILFLEAIHLLGEIFISDTRRGVGNSKDGQGKHLTSFF